MGNFIGGIGAAFIMAAAAAVVVRFLLEINIIKSREAVLLYGKLSVMTVIVGAAYVFAAVYIYNESKESANYFAFDTVFRFLGIENTLNLCKEPHFGELFGGLLMPLYPCLVHVIGKPVFEQYVLTAQFISFAASCVSSCALYSMISKKTSADNTENIMLLTASLPYVFMLFTPSYISLTVMFTVLAAYALSKNSIKAYLILSVIACLTGKLGLIAFALHPLMGSAPKLLTFTENKILKNKILLRIIIALLLMFNGAVIFYLVRGI